MKSNETINKTNLGGCHIFFLKKKMYVCREVFNKSRKQEINFQLNKIVWDNRFEIEHKKKFF